MAQTSINIHNTISGVMRCASTPDAISFQVHSPTDGYSDVTFFTGDAALCDALANAFNAYLAKAQAAEIADRERDNIANGQDIDEPETEDAEAE